MRRPQGCPSARSPAGVATQSSFSYGDGSSVVLVVNVVALIGWAC